SIIIDMCFEFNNHYTLSLRLVHWIFQTEAVTANREDVVPRRINLVEAVTQTAYQRVNCLLAHAFADRAGPDGIHHLIARADAPAVQVKQFKQAVLWRAEGRVNFDVLDEDAP